WAWIVRGQMSGLAETLARPAMNSRRRICDLLCAASRMVKSRCGSQAYLSFSATRIGAASDLRMFRMGFEVTIYAFVVLPLHFNPVVWNEDNGYATYQAIRSAAPLICDLDRRFDWLNWSLKRF